MEDLKYIKSVMVKAGKIALKHFHNLDKIQTSEKSLGDYFSNADLECEKFIKNKLNKRFPGFSFIAEESGVEETNSEYCWVIDPIDGTINFLHGLPLFACCLCLKKNKKTILSIVYFPALDELYYASQNKEGAFLEHPKKRTRAMKIKKINRTNISSYLFSYGIGKDNIDEVQKIIKNMPDICSIRSFGASSKDILELVKGCFDAYIIPHIKCWDLYPSAYIAEKAGYKLYNIKGIEVSKIKNYSGEEHGIIITSPKIMKKIKKLL